MAFGFSKPDYKKSAVGGDIPGLRAPASSFGTTKLPPVQAGHPGTEPASARKTVPKMGRSQSAASPSASIRPRSILKDSRAAPGPFDLLLEDQQPSAQDDAADENADASSKYTASQTHASQSRSITPFKPSRATFGADGRFITPDSDTEDEQPTSASQNRRPTDPPPTQPIQIQQAPQVSYNTDPPALEDEQMDPAEMTRRQMQYQQHHPASRHFHHQAAVPNYDFVGTNVDAPESRRGGPLFGLYAVPQEDATSGKGPLNHPERGRQGSNPTQGQYPTRAQQQQAGQAQTMTGFANPPVTPRKLDSVANQPTPARGRAQSQAVPQTPSRIYRTRSASALGWHNEDANEVPLVTVAAGFQAQLDETVSVVRSVIGDLALLSASSIVRTC